MKPLPKDAKNPLAGGGNHVALILWLAYREAKDAIEFDERSEAGEEPVNRPTTAQKNAQRDRERHRCIARISAQGEQHHGDQADEDGDQPRDAGEGHRGILARAADGPSPGPRSARSARERGDRWCERIGTVMATCGQRGRSVFEYLDDESRVAVRDIIDSSGRDVVFV